MTRTEMALRRRRMNRKIRETVAMRRFIATIPVAPGPVVPTSGADGDQTSATE